MDYNKSKDRGQVISEMIRKRRSIFPKSYTPEKIAKEIIEEILENANYAPTHRLTQPWRFKVMTGEKLKALGILMGDLYQKKMSPEKFSEMKFNKTVEKPTLCSHVIAICMERDAKESLPEWEEVAAVAMAVQNMWLTAAAYGIGAYWSSPSTVETKACHDFLNLKAGQRCLGLFYMGYHEMPELDANRSPISDKVEWL